MAGDNDKVDALIVGAGAAGLQYAAILGEAGKSVRVLEMGPAWELDDLYSSQIWARRLKWSEPHVLDEGDDSIGFVFNSGQGFGGAAIHHYAGWPRMHEDDFTIRSEHGRGLDWPFEYGELRPYYDRMQAEAGVAGDAEAEVWRPPGDPYPLPPQPLFAQATALARGFEALDMRVAPLPVAILTQPYKGRPACIWDGWCDAGCPTGALANPLVLHMPAARRAGVVFQAGCTVTRIQTNRRGDRATGVEYYDAEGEKHTAQADVIILAGSTVPNVRLLLHSASAVNPDGLANRSGTVGRYLMTHPAVLVYGLFDEDLDNHMGISGAQLLSQEDWRKDSHKDAFGSRQWSIAQSLKPNDLLGIANTRPDLINSELQDFVERGVRGLATMASTCEDQPLPENHIELDASRKDRFGIPLAKVNYRMGPDGRRLWEISRDEGLELLRAAGAKEQWSGGVIAQHTMGGTIMGENPDRSVTNSYAQCHDVPNLFIGGAGVFPTSSAANPTFTLYAVGLRSAEYLRDNWSAIVA